MRQQDDIRGGKGRTGAPSAGGAGPNGALAERTRPPEPRSGAHDTATSDAPGSPDPGNTAPPAQGRRPRRRIFRWISVVLALLLLAAAGGGYLWFRHLNGNLETGERSAVEGGLEAPEPDALGNTPLNVLVIGSDSRNSEKNLDLGGSRDSVGQKPLADVQMLLHLSADRSNASLVSIPRDTRVDIPECTDAATGQSYPAVNGLINSTLGRGGPGCTLATWEKLTGVYIDHWVTVDFAGVVAMADAVGGVDVCVKQNVWDRALPGVPGGSGLKLTAGTHSVKGRTALQWLRTRHAFYSDLGRAKAQHMYLNSMLRKLKSQSVFTDTGRLLDLAEAATKSLTVSQEIGSVDALYDLGRQFRTVPTDRVTSATMPTVQDPANANHLLPGPGASRIWSMLQEDVPLDSNGKDGDGGSDGTSSTDPGPANEASASPSASASPADGARTAGAVPVSVLNGTAGGGGQAVDGRASEVTAHLQGAGFARAVALAAQQPQEETTLSYPEAGGEQARSEAQAVAEALGFPKASVEASAGVQSVTLVVGADWPSGEYYSAPEAGSIPDSADSLNGSDRGACMEVYEPYRW
ncbi:LCP family protein [Streptomyces sp. TR06-5]|uniref:LCP family protein n=1 Tax=unclassified Streptomyces TaxID=2593676 RepID=UPI0039A2AF17